MNYYQRALKTSSISDILKKALPTMALSIIPLFANYLEAKYEEPQKVQQVVQDPAKLKNEEELFQAIRANEIQGNEKKTLFRHLDSLGKPTIGAGFLLSRPDTRSKLRSIGILEKEIDDVINGLKPLTEEQRDLLLKITIDEAKVQFQRSFPQIDEMLKDLTLENQARVKNVLIDMTFNMGSVEKLKKFKENLNNKNWNEALLEMIRSNYFFNEGKEVLMPNGKVMRERSKRGIHHRALRNVQTLAAAFGLEDPATTLVPQVIKEFEIIRHPPTTRKKK
jgi:GH24 family phage-related lysozyme (muramidase)